MWNLVLNSFFWCVFNMWCLGCFSTTGAIMENLAKDLLDVKMCSFLPKHNRNLSNEFRCFVNYPSRLLSCWGAGRPSDRRFVPSSWGRGDMWTISHEDQRSLHEYTENGKKLSQCLAVLMSGLWFDDCKFVIQTGCGNFWRHGLYFKTKGWTKRW